MLKGCWLILIAIGGLVGALIAPSQATDYGCQIVGGISKCEPSAKKPQSITRNNQRSAQYPLIFRSAVSDDANASQNRQQDSKKTCEKRNTPPDDRECRDLLAQETMARWTRTLGWVGLISVPLLIATLAANTWAVIATRKIGQAQVRAYLSVIRAEVVDPEYLSNAFDILVTVRNFGQSPAVDFRWSVEPTLQYYASTLQMSPDENDLAVITPHETPAVISAGAIETVRFSISTDDVDDIVQNMPGAI